MDEQIVFSKLQSELSRGTDYKECFFTGCQDAPIRSHSLQNNRILNRISRDGVVLRFEPKIINGEFNTELEEVGRGKASTFYGFCGNHDTQLFSPIEREDYVIGNKEQEFLFAYRALAKEFCTKKTASNLFSKTLGLTDSEFTQLKAKLELSEYFRNDSTKEYISAALQGTKESIDKLNGFKEAMNINLNNKRFDRISTRVIELQEEYCIAVSSIFYVEYDVLGNRINDLAYFVDMKPIFLTIFQQNGKTYILLSWFSKNNNGFQFVDQQIISQSKIKQKTIISNMIAQYVENVFISPMKWDALREFDKKRFTNLFKQTLFCVKSSLLYDPNLDVFI
ncbi:MAG TPA: hypothetical protein DDW50_03220 [Firmicutes bacterium]|jgi:hypothetical protein|nr:hypothetical protein [Bacillota bacterium]